MKVKLLTMYLDWANNFLTVSCFAEYYGIGIDKANRIINIGRKIHEDVVAKRK